MTAGEITILLGLPGYRAPNSASTPRAACQNPTRLRAANTLRLAAVNVGRTNTALGAFYRRPPAHLGAANAVTTTVRKLAVRLYNTLRGGMAYQNPRPSYYEEQYRRRLLTGLHQRAKELGDELLAVGATEGVS